MQQIKNKVREAAPALRLCPFCGAPASVLRVPGYNLKDTFFATCTGCGVETPRVAPTAQAAADAWNRRT